jgi:4-carboxymuconolactone decarboxylase
MESEIFKKGIAKRRKVLGDAYVDKALASADEMGADMQKLVTEYAWGEVWNKENLSDRDRSLVNLGMIAALNRPHEFKLHVKGAINNGLTRLQIRDVVLQITIYCGAPAGLDSLRLVREVFKDLDEEKS